MPGQPRSLFKSMLNASSKIQSVFPLATSSRDLTLVSLSSFPSTGMVNKEAILG
ncbi:hypothetical protein MMC14_010195, partial [Varicellaria rhodocarpa]|nr:hypothetical protein [Varicellaria rhodocarpa]